MEQAHKYNVGSFWFRSGRFEVAGFDVLGTVGIAHPKTQKPLQIAVKEPLQPRKDPTI